MRRTLVTMIPLSLSLAVLCVLSVWTIEQAAGCGDRQLEVAGQCCDQCPPGTFMKDYCSKNRQTVCSRCPDGFSSDQYNMFDRCEECQSCQHECVENKCVTGEKLKRTEKTSEQQLEMTSEQRPETHRDGLDSVHLILGIGFVLISITLLVFLSYACVKNLKKHKAYNYPTEVLAVSTNTSDFHLSKEESGHELIMQDESKNSNSVGPLSLEEVGTCYYHV